MSSILVVSCWSQIQGIFEVSEKWFILLYIIHLYTVSYKSISIKFLFIRIERYYLINRNSYHSLDIGTERKSYPSTFVICHTKVAEAFL